MACNSSNKRNPLFQLAMTQFSYAYSSLGLSVLAHWPIRDVVIWKVSSPNIHIMD